jgi:hypothetical protein
MKNKIFFFIFLSLLSSNYIYKTIWNLKYNNPPKENTPQEKNNPQEKNKKIKKNIEGDILENNFTEIIINKGYKDNIKINMICEGEEGFIGLVASVEKNYSIIKTFWYINWKLILIDGNNNYGYLNSNGYFLYVSTSSASNSEFEDNIPLYIISNKEKSLIGTIKKIKGNIYKITPKENILKIKKVYLK